MKENVFEKYPVLKHLLLMLAITIAILIVVFMLLKVYARQGKEFELPDVVGQKYETLGTDNPLNLKYVVIDSIYKQGSEGGIVLNQDPEGGTKVKKGRKVYISITRYSEDDAIVPEITGSPLRTAISQLGKEGIQIGTLKFIEGNYPVSSSRIPPTVHNITFKGKELYPGQTVSRGSAVDLVVELGDGEHVSTVPFLLGKSPEKARKSVLSSALNIQEHFKGNVKDKSKAVVYRQEPDYTGVVKYPYGTQVTLWYCNADEVDVDQMIRDFKVDSTLLPQDENSWNQNDEDFIIQSEGWSW